MGLPSFWGTLYMAIDPKPYESVPQLLQKLRARGMAVGDERKAEACLRRIGYYRLSGYWYPMRSSVEINNLNGTTTVSVQDQFRPQSDFMSVFELYVFDKRLRLLMLDAIERVEVGVRVAIADHMGQKSPTAHLKPEMLDGKFTKDQTQLGRTGHEKWVDKYNWQISRSREEFVKHFKIKYPDLLLPIWVGSEVWDFGTLSIFFAGLKYADRRALARMFGNIGPELLTSWLRAINGVRNACAHHNRLWNAPLVEMPRSPQPQDDPILIHLAGNDLLTVNELSKTRLYAVAASLQFLLKTINPSSTWAARVKAHCCTFPQNPSFQFRQSGFPEGWEDLPLWS
jgi:abortive infection bacteriophage resistance protein